MKTYMWEAVVGDIWEAFFAARFVYYLCGEEGFADLHVFAGGCSVIDVMRVCAVSAKAEASRGGSVYFSKTGDYQTDAFILVCLENR